MIVIVNNKTISSHSFKRSVSQLRSLTLENNLGDDQINEVTKTRKWTK